MVDEGTRLPVFCDHHVHLGLVDPGLLRRRGIGAVVDLGGSRDIARLAAEVPLEAAYAGQFVTAPGGYPSDRAWAPAGSIAFVAGPHEAGQVVKSQRALGASLVKVTLNREAGPVPDLATLTAVVDAAENLPVVAHAQGGGTVELALAAGVAALAHAPWTERLDDELIGECAAARQRWISTLDIHGYGDRTTARLRAIDNLARFRAAGGSVLYGTDLGNGPLPVGLNLREVAALQEAGLTDDDVLRALTDPWPNAATAGLAGTLVPGAREDRPLTEWLSQARVVPARPKETQ